MKTLLKVAGFSLLLAGVAVLSYSQGRQAERDRQAIRQRDIEFQKVAAERGAEGFASFFAEDAVIMRNGPVVGPKAIQEVWAPFFARAGNREDWAPTRAETEHDLGCTLGRYTRTVVSDQGEKTTRAGTYVTAWRRQPDKSWKAIFDGGVPDPPIRTKP